jgi:hypothetical protein
MIKAQLFNLSKGSLSLHITLHSIFYLSFKTINISLYLNLLPLLYASALCMASLDLDAVGWSCAAPFSSSALCVDSLELDAIVWSCVAPFSSSDLGLVSSGLRRTNLISTKPRDLYINQITNRAQTAIICNSILHKISDM